MLNTRVNFISPQVDTSTQTILAKASETRRPTGSVPQELVKARITWKHRANDHHSGSGGVSDGRPVSSHLSPKNKDGKDVARQVPLTLGEITGNDYSVISGLKAGENIIVSGGQNLADGMSIKIEP